MNINENANIPEIPLDMMVGTFPDVWWIISTVLVLILFGFAIVILQRILDMLSIIKEGIFAASLCKANEEESKPKKRKA